jgi:hypothetical protein
MCVQRQQMARETGSASRYLRWLSLWGDFVMGLHRRTAIPILISMVSAVEEGFRKHATVMRCGRATDIGDL